MLSPEVWNFHPSKHHFSYENRNYRYKKAPFLLRTHYFNHSVSVILPDFAAIPKSLQNCLLEDSDYYRVNNLRVSDLINQEFIEAFVKNGELILLSIDGNIDICNSVAITPDGKLIISLVNDDYYKLGLGGKASFFDQSIDTRHVVKIDLTDDAFTPGKKEYEHARQCLNENIDQRFNVILKWEPKVDQVCPSSIASWFHEHGYHVSLCCQKFNYRTKYSLTIPTMENGYDNDKFFEWLGVFSIAGEMKTDDQLEEYVNTYQCPEPFTKVGQAHYLQWKGFFTRNQIEKIYNLLKTYISEQNSSTWISLDVQGFLDCPISWQLNEHTYFMDGDNSYTIVLLSNDKSVIRKSLSSNNKPTLHQ